MTQARRAILPALALAATLATPVAAEDVWVADSFYEFTNHFCQVERHQMHVFVLPLAAFAENPSIQCGWGDSKLSRSVPVTDEDSIIVDVAPPEGFTGWALTCGGRAPEKARRVGISCLPVQSE